MTRPLSYRSPNFTAKEVEALIYNLELKPELITPAARVTRDGTKTSSGLLSVQDKVEIWNELANEINLAGEGDLTGVMRSGADIRKKWNDLKSRVKLKASDIRKGKLSDSLATLSPLEERVLQLIAKTSDIDGINNALPPAYFNYTRQSDSLIDDDNDMSKSNDFFKPKDRGEPHIVKTVKSENTLTTPIVTVPHFTEIPIITFPSSIAINALPSINNTESSTSNRKRTENQNDADDEEKDIDKMSMMAMLYESQRNIKRELHDIKRILLNISQRKRKRIEQENEKIQLKKMKLLLMCKKQGIDFDEFITDFL